MLGLAPTLPNPGNPGSATAEVAQGYLVILANLPKKAHDRERKTLAYVPLRLIHTDETKAKKIKRKVDVAENVRFRFRSM